jgi:hypothetical protein
LVIARDHGAHAAARIARDVLIERATPEAAPRWARF